jgi:hypothetical protein
MKNEDIKAGDVIMATVTTDINKLAPLTIPLAGKRVKLKASFLNPDDGLWGFMSLDPQPTIGPMDIGPHWLYLSQLDDVELVASVEVVFERELKEFYPILNAEGQSVFSQLFAKLVLSENSPLLPDTAYKMQISFKLLTAENVIECGGFKVIEDPEFDLGEDGGTATTLN